MLCCRRAMRAFLAGLSSAAAAIAQPTAPNWDLAAGAIAILPDAIAPGQYRVSLAWTLSVSAPPPSPVEVQVTCRFRRNGQELGVSSAAESIPSVAGTVSRLTALPASASLLPNDVVTAVLVSDALFAETHSDNNALTVVFAGAIFWDRWIERVQFQPSTTGAPGTYDATIVIRLGISSLTDDGDPNRPVDLDCAVSTRVDGVPAGGGSLVARIVIPEGDPPPHCGDPSCQCPSSQCCWLKINNQIVNGDCAAAQDALECPCSFIKVKEIAGLVIGTRPAGRVAIRLDARPGALPELLPADDEIQAVLPACPGDTTGDGVVDLNDLAQLLGHFGAGSGAAVADGDMNGDGAVDLADLAIVLSFFGFSCP